MARWTGTGTGTGMMMTGTRAAHRAVHQWLYGAV